MYRRPWPILFLAYFQVFMAPAINAYLNAHLSGLPTSDYLRALFETGDWAGLFFILGLPVIMGKAIFDMKRWSYAVFVVCSTLVLYKNLSALQTAHTDQMIALALCLGNISIVGYFLIPAVRAPFFDSRLRWWETDKRYCVTLNARVEHDSKNVIESIPCQIRDISLGGAFVSMPTGTQIAQEKMIRIRFSPNNRHILSVRSKIVFHRSLDGESEGYGLQFIETTAATLSMIETVIRGLEAAGCPSRNPDLTAWQDLMVWIETLINTGQGLLPQKSRVKPRPAPIPLPAELVPETPPSESTLKQAA
jgi:hypothetical protein